MVTYKVVTIYFNTFILTSVLLVSFGSSAFAQGERSRRERQSQETANQAETLFLDALLLSDNGDSKSARLQLLKAMGLWMQIREPGKAARAALQVGDRCKKARKYQDALSYYRMALDIKSLPGAVKANGLNSIATIYAGLYLHAQAMRYFNQALDQARVINDLPAQILALTGLADVYHNQGALAKALSCITSALRLSKKDHAEADPGLLYLKGRVGQEQGFIEDAKSAFEEALAIHRKTYDTQGQVRVLCAMSSLSLLASRKEAALEQAKEAADLADKQARRRVSDADEINTRESRWHAWLSKARAERAMEQKERALNSYSRAIDHFKAIYWEFYIATEASAVAFREEAQTAYREYADLLVEQGQIKEAYKVIEEAKARTLLNLIGARRGRPPSEGSKQGAALRELYGSLTKPRLQLLASYVSREQEAKLQKEIEEIEFKIDEARLAAEMEHAGDRLVWSQPATADQLQEQMAHAQMTLVEFSLGEERSFLWLFTRGEVLFEVLPARKKIETAVKRYLDMLAGAPDVLYLQTDLAKLKEQSEALFVTLFDRLSPRIEQGQQLIVVPDGLLHYLPFEALIHNGHYLVEDHEISYLPSASMLTQLQDSRAEAESRDKMELLAFGDPVFSPERKASIPKKRRSNPVKVGQNGRPSRGFQRRPIPRTYDEVQYIASLFPRDRTKLYLGKDSTEDVLKRESLHRFRRLHFATHSLIDEVSPSRSAVRLSLDAGQKEDGLLEVSEISELNLDCDTVVLSACQTGRGQLLSGEGIVGLSRAFLYAGARAVLVSLWNVSDISTGDLMKGFYRHLADGTGNTAALRKAKLDMLKSGRETQHPYYWASFITIGKP